MFSKEVIDLLFQVVKSWQVIAMTVVLVAYMFFFNYVARGQRRPRSVSKSKPRKLKAAKAMKKATPSEAPDSENINEALGL